MLCEELLGFPMYLRIGFRLLSSKASLSFLELLLFLVFGKKGSHLSLSGAAWAFQLCRKAMPLGDGAQRSPYRY